MKRVTAILEKICTKGVAGIAVLIFGAFTFWAAIYSHEHPRDYMEEKISGYMDSSFWNLAIALLVILVVYILRRLLLRGNEEQKRRLIWRLALVITILVGIGTALWVTVCHVTPVHDQLQVYCTAREFRNGNYQDMLGYFYMHPHQYSLAFLYELFFYINQSILFFQYINVLFVMVIVYFTYLISEELFHNQEVNLFALLGIICFLPLYMYANFVYGDLPAIALGMMGIWAVLRWCDAKKTKYLVMAPACFVFATLFRKNTLVILLAVLICLVIYSLRSLDWRGAVLGVMILVLPILGIQGVQHVYELRSGIEIGDGIPSVSWIAMGMQECWNGAGVYNAYNESVFWGIAEGDTYLANKIARKYIKERTAEFLADPGLARNFYRFKLLGQWNESTFSSQFMTHYFEEPPNGFVESVYYGRLQEVYIKTMNRYVFIIYLGVLVSAGVSLFRERTILQSLPLIAVIGGVLFSILWEAKGRYVFPYMLLLLPYMAQGIFSVQQGAEIAIRKIRNIKR